MNVTYVKRAPTDPSKQVYENFVEKSCGAEVAKSGADMASTGARWGYSWK